MLTSKLKHPVLAPWVIHRNSCGRVLRENSPESKVLASAAQIETSLRGVTVVGRESLRKVAVGSLLRLGRATDDGLDSESHSLTVATK